MKRWEVWKGYEYVLLEPFEFKGFKEYKNAIKYYNPAGKLVAIQVLRRKEDLGQLKIPVSSSIEE